MGKHLIDGEFQSDKYPTTPHGKVPLSVKDPMAQDLLAEYARRRREVDSEFSDDLEEALKLAGFKQADSEDITQRIRQWCDEPSHRLPVEEMVDALEEIRALRSDLGRAKQSTAKAPDDVSGIAIGRPDDTNAYGIPQPGDVTQIRTDGEALDLTMPTTGQIRLRDDVPLPLANKTGEELVQGLLKYLDEANEHKRLLMSVAQAANRAVEVSSNLGALVPVREALDALPNDVRRLLDPDAEGHAPADHAPPPVSPASAREIASGGVRNFARAILHGDEEHRRWLLEAAEAFVEGRELPEPVVRTSEPL